MAGSSRTETAVADALFEKYALPKIALAIILAASLLGTAVTIRLTDGWALGLAVAKWSFFVSLGVLTGGLLWKHWFVSPADLDADAREYCTAMYDRFDGISVASLLVLAASGPVVLAQYHGAFGRSPVVLAAAGLYAATIALTLLTVFQSGPASRQFRRPSGLAALLVAGMLVAVTAAAEVGLGGGGPAAVGVRVAHLAAFSAWIGGAVWNIFVAVPTGKAQPTVGVVRAAGQQLERFRWAVRAIIPTLLLTGLYQAVDALGTTVGPFLGSLVGLAVLAKLGTIGVLFVIFMLCPMWRACSPIDGVCDLEDLGAGGEPPDTEGVADD